LEEKWSRKNFKEGRGNNYLAIKKAGNNTNDREKTGIWKGWTLTQIKELSPVKKESPNRRKSVGCSFGSFPSKFGGRLKENPSSLILP